MRSLTFNRQDWTGRTETMQIADNDLSFVLMGYHFRLKRQPQSEDDLITYVAHIHGREWPADHSLGSVVKFKGDTYYTAIGMDLHRDADTPYLAAALLLCNLV